MNAFGRSICALTALALAAIGVSLALTKLPPAVEVRAGDWLGPWLILWSLAWITVVSAAAIVGLLVAASHRP